MKNKPTYGGQAVIEGVMIRGQRYACVAVRRPDHSIALRSDRIGVLFTGVGRKVPFIRGVIVLMETLSLGMKALTYSTNVGLEAEGEEIGKATMVGMMAFAILFAITLFFLIPVLASRPLDGILGSDIVSNLVEGVIRLAIFLGYVWIIGRMQQINRVFMYHGAEHMSIHAMENGDPLDIAHVRKYKTAHPRCGTAFLLVVMVVSILVFAFIPREPLWWLITSRIVLLPVIAAFSYEAIRFSGKYPNNGVLRIVNTPSLALQTLTTRQPDDSQIEIAIVAMEQAIEADQGHLPRP